MMTLILTAINFVILAVGIGWLISKYGTPFLRQRRNEIGEGLAAGERAQAEAERRAAEVQAKLSNLEKEIAALRSAAKEERDREADRIRRESQAEMARIHAQAEMEIESAGKQARLEVQRAAAKLAIELAETRVRQRMSSDLQSSLVRGFVADLPRSGGIHVE